MNPQNSVCYSYPYSQIKEDIERHKKEIAEGKAIVGDSWKFLTITNMIVDTIPISGNILIFGKIESFINKSGELDFMIDLSK